MKAQSEKKLPERVWHELKQRKVYVSQIENLGERMRSITFGGESLADFVSPSFEDHVKLVIQGADGDVTRRDYTPRSYDPQNTTLTLEIGLHENGAGAGWAASAQVGDAAVIAGPRGSMIIAKDYSWHLLVGDATALPAIHRRLEELPQGVRAIVRILVPEGVERRAMESNAELDLQWFDQPSELLASLKALTLPCSEDGFAWCAGEAALMAGAKKILQEDKALPQHSMKIGVYWKSGDADYHENLVRPE